MDPSLESLRSVTSMLKPLLLMRGIPISHDTPFANPTQVEVTVPTPVFHQDPPECARQLADVIEDYGPQIASDSVWMAHGNSNITLYAYVGLG